MNLFLFTFISLFSISGGISASAFANSLTVRDIVLGDQNQIEIKLDGVAAKNSMDIDYVRDIVQFSIQNATIYPAKIVHADKQAFSKVFAYQYSPSLVRIRFSVDGKADSFSGKVKWIQKGKSIFVNFPAGIAAAPVKDDTSNERSLLAKVLGQGKKEAVKVEEIKPEVEAKEQRAQEAKLKQEAIVEKAAQKEAAQKEVAKEKEERAEKLANTAERINDKNSDSTEIKISPEKTIHLGANRPLSTATLGGQHGGASAFRSFLAMFCVVGGLGLVLIFVKRKQNNVQAKKVGDGWLSNLLPASMRKQKSFIEVLGTHSLGAKQSIVVIRIKGQQMVLGVTQDNVQLITQLESDDSELGLLEDPAVAASIGKMFGGAPTVAPTVAMPKAVSTNASFNSLLKSSTGAGAVMARNAYSAQGNSAAPVTARDPYANLAAATQNYSNAVQDINPVRAQANSIRNQIKQRLEGMKNG